MAKLSARIFIATAILTSVASFAQDDVTDVVITSETVSVEPVSNSSTQSTADNAATPDRYDTPFARHFTWGASLGSSIDMTGQDMTAIDIDAFVGYKGDYIRFAGIGAGIRMMVSNSSRSYPIYGMLRTSFTRNPSFLYLEVKGGVGLNNLYTNVYQRKFIGGLAVGFTLAHSRTFSSNFSLGYEYMPLSPATIEGTDTHFHDIHYAAIRIGASF
ncbi:MAG: hypothetical protein HDS52_06355 [Barnesiella sp.]|nr:hypothetical protein [Barnesiella sp.]